MKYETSKQRLMELANLNKQRANLKEDYSTMSLKSNINQKWKTADDMAGDMQQWLSSIYASAGENTYQEVMDILGNLVDNFDPTEDGEF